MKKTTGKIKSIASVCLSLLMLSSCKSAQIEETKTQVQINDVTVTQEISETEIQTQESLLQDEYQPYHVSSHIQQAYQGSMPVFCFASEGECSIITMDMESANQYSYWLERIDSNGILTEIKLPDINQGSQLVAAAGTKEVTYLISSKIKSESEASTEKVNAQIIVIDRNGTLLSQSECQEITYQSGRINAESFKVDAEGKLWFIQSDTKMLVSLGQGGETLVKTDISEEPITSIISGKKQQLFGLLLAANPAESKISRLDISNGSLGETYDISLDEAEAIYPGMRGMFFLETEDEMYEYYPESNSRKKLFSYIENGITRLDVICVMNTQDERIVIVSWDKQNKEFLIDILEKNLQEYIKSVISIATMQSSEYLKELVTMYSKTNLLYTVQIKEYEDQFDTSDNSADALTRLQADLMTGSTDMLDISSLTDEVSRQQLVKMGVLEDLNPWIDKDVLVDRENFNQKIWEVNEINGGLYNLVPFYKIDTVFGRASEVTNSHRCTLNQILALGEPSTVYGKNHTWKEIIYDYCLYMLEGTDEHIRSELENTETLQKILTFASAYPEEYDPTIETISDLHFHNQYLSVGSIDRDLFSYTINQAYVGEQISCIGYPTSEGIGSSFENIVSIGICSTSDSKEAAWDFLRLCLSEDIQGDTENFASLKSGIPVYQSQWESIKQPQTQEEAAANPGAGIFREDMSWYVIADPITQQVIDDTTLLISEIDKVNEVDPQLYQILESEAAEYIYGRSTLEEAVNHISSRVRILLDERSE